MQRLTQINMSAHQKRKKHAEAQPTHRCKECSFINMSKSALNKHLATRAARGFNGMPAYRCELSSCDKVFCTEDAARGHHLTEHIRNGRTPKQIETRKNQQRQLTFDLDSTAKVQQARSNPPVEPSMQSNDYIGAEIIPQTSGISASTAVTPAVLANYDGLGTFQEAGDYTNFSFDNGWNMNSPAWANTSGPSASGEAIMPGLTVGEMAKRMSGDDACRMCQGRPHRPECMFASTEPYSSWNGDVTSIESATAANFGDPIQPAQQPTPEQPTPQPVTDFQLRKQRAIKTGKAKCEHCDFVGTSARDLRNHVKSREKHSITSPQAQCFRCSRRFCLHNGLNRHVCPAEAPKDAANKAPFAVQNGTGQRAMAVAPPAQGTVNTALAPTIARTTDNRLQHTQTTSPGSMPNRMLLPNSTTSPAMGYGYHLERVISDQSTLPLGADRDHTNSSMIPDQTPIDPALYSLQDSTQQDRSGGKIGEETPHSTDSTFAILLSRMNYQPDIANKDDSTNISTPGLTSENTSPGSNEVGTPDSNGQRRLLDSAEESKASCTCGQPPGYCFCGISLQDWIDAGEQAGMSGYYD